MTRKIKEEIIAIYKKIEDATFSVYLVGGCVRDLFMGRPITDWDLATSATPEQIQTLFDTSFYDNAFGTVGIPLKTLPETEHPGIVEITTFRTEHGYTDRRRPDHVVWGKTIEEDLARRDFTINAMALKLVRDGQKVTTSIIDPFNGQSDIHHKTIRAVGNPSERFQEDALRLLRAIRFATQLGFIIEGDTWNAILSNASLLDHISAERIQAELLRILSSDYPYEGTKLLDNAGMLGLIIPELLKGKQVSQERPGRHHKTDVFTHNLLALKLCPSKDPIVRFATLIHDVGKPYVESRDELNLVTFYNHEVVGARLASQIVQRLKFSKKQKEKIYALVRWHMFSVDEHITDSAVRRFIRRVGVENVNDIIDLRIGDRLGSGVAKAESWRLRRFKERIEKELHPPFSMNDLAVDGHDVMRELNIPPGPKVGNMLQQLFEEVDEDLSKNNKEYLLQRIKEFSDQKPLS